MNENQHKSDREVLLEFFNEAFGYDKGIKKTILALKNKPIDVVDSYLTNKGEFVGPFRLLFAVLALWLLVNGAFINWYDIWRSYMELLQDFSIRLYNLDEKEIELFKEFYAKFINVFVPLLGDLFTKFYIPYILVQIPLSGLLIKRFLRKYNIELKRILVIISYFTFINSFTFFIMSIAFAIHIVVGIVLVMSIFIPSLFGKNFLAISPIRNFFAENGSKIERGFTKGQAVVSLGILIFMSLFYIL